MRREAAHPLAPSRLTPHASPLTPEVAIVAGEASGDLLGSLLINALQKAGIRASFSGIAGPKMQSAGARSLFPMEALSVRGYVEALGGLRRILGIRKQLGKQLRSHPPRLFIGVDAPDFNLALEARLKRARIPTVHFVSPSIWAWRGSRIKKIRRAVDHMLLVFPFEEDIYRNAGIPATYVGHPIAYALPPKPDRLAARERLKLRSDGEYIALLPGSRVGELKALADLYVAAAKQLAEQRPGTGLLVPLVNRETRLLFEQSLARAGGELPIRLLFGHAHDVLQAADVALIASGTATLEALLLGCPHVITYRVPWLTWRIMRRQAYLPWVGLPNILAARAIVPEILQQDATPEALAQALLTLLDDKTVRAAMTDAFERLADSLRRDTPALIAQALRPYLA